MYVVTIGAYLFKFDVVALFDFLGDFLYRRGKWWFEKGSAVLNRKDDVVVRVVDAVVAFGDAHALQLT